MPSNTFSPAGLAARVVAAFLVVFATWNPEGWSYYHWAIQPLFEGGGFDAVKFLAGMLLLAAWVVFLQATRRSIGVAGSLLVAAICGGVIWLLISQHLASARSSRGVANIALVGLAVILAVGMSWSHVSRRLTGQADTDVVD